MNVIDMTLQIILVADDVLPMAALPNSLLALGDLAWGSPCIDGEPARKTALDQAQSKGEVRIAYRQRPQSVQVVRQHTNGDRLKWKALLNGRVDPPQPV